MEIGSWPRPKVCRHLGDEVLHSFSLSSKENEVLHCFAVPFADLSNIWGFYFYTCHMPIALLGVLVLDPFVPLMHGCFLYQPSSSSWFPLCPFSCKLPFFDRELFQLSPALMFCLCQYHECSVEWKMTSLRSLIITVNILVHLSFMVS